ncbi:(E)-4-hydroxy-3-methylbut-2-enyl-diphosphate synthase [Flavobacteriales bacterium]|nr:(E)-4-hydroxy-3-methylbut-2-enyl-diphosphate synthase [Flavobacteriales bacterium]
MSKEKPYCNSLTKYSRFKTREVMVGKIGVGGENPIRVQSMTTADTMNTEKSVAESISLAKVGCEIVRLTAPSKKDAYNLQVIKDEIIKQGYDIPLVADIHFTPNAAEVAADIVEKIRVNPGNYADKKQFKDYEYTDNSYQEELIRIEEKFTPLVLKCKKNGVAMRIGTNHGSLSDRILSRYGDTPLGMVESAMEFIRICEKNEYYELVLSMKASNPKVMVQAYRLLVAAMIENNMNYPLHLGVTEAGEGEDGRIKSAIGIGTLLEDGIGDTIRVSLTESAESEIPVAQNLVKRYSHREDHEPIETVSESFIDPYEYTRRKTNIIKNIGSKHVPIVMADFSLKKEIKPASFFALGYNYSVPLDKWNITDKACDYVFTNKNTVEFEIPGTLGLIHEYNTWLTQKSKDNRYPFLDVKQYLSECERHTDMNFVYVLLSDCSEDLFAKLNNDKTAVLIIDTYNKHGLAEQRAIFNALIENNCKAPVVIGRAYGDLPKEELQIDASVDMGGLLIDGLGDGIFIAAENCGGDLFLNDTAFGILQATRTRISKTDYISCPSCGRTLFDLQETTAKIRAKTSHLKGLKIGIMGCIVNGPGEMADADYGYVGTGKGKITLYKEKEVVKKNIPEEDALNELINLIKEYDDWVDV